jgi:MoaA/NifB/PqqE/SkfB family radical SAM enzyme
MPVSRSGFRRMARQYTRRAVVWMPPIRRYLAEKTAIYVERERLKGEALSLTAERDWLLGQLQSGQSSSEPPKFVLHPAEALLQAITSGDDLTSVAVHSLACAVEEQLASPSADKIGIHRQIGKALFARSVDLYSGRGLPHYLVRYTYPPVISIALSSHCNAACFFCRTAEYKGTSIEFDEIKKLESAIRNARVVDLTGWGEPFFYPRLREVVEYILSVNTSTPHLIQVTSNGTLLSKDWGKLLAGKINNVIISMNAGSSATYAEQMAYKNNRFTLDRTIESIREFMGELTIADRSRVILHMVANTGNFREISPMMSVAKELGITYVNVGNFICADAAHMSKTLWNVKEEYNAEIENARKFGAEIGVGINARTFFVDEKKQMGAELCVAPFDQFFIEMQGTTAPCCFMGGERMGNVYQDGFEAVWFSDLMNKLRADRFLPPCKVCTVFTPFDDQASHISAFLLLQ